MRSTSFGILGIALVAIIGCSGEDVSAPPLPALAGVRYINAVSDTGRIDVKMIDQVEWSANTVTPLNFREGMEHMPTEAKARRIRAFSYASTNISVVQQIIADTTLTFAPNGRYTVLLTGSARAKTVKFVLISDDAPALTPGSTGTIAVRAVNASTGAINGYVTTTPADAISGTPAASNLAPNTASPYITRTAGNVAVRVTDVGSTTANASAGGPPGTTNPTGDAGTFFPSAGVNNGGSAFSVYYFPRGTAGSLQTSTTPTVIWFVDRVPTA